MPGSGLLLGRREKVLAVKARGLTPISSCRQLAWTVAVVATATPSEALAEVCDKGGPSFHWSLSLTAGAALSVGSIFLLVLKRRWADWLSGAISGLAAGSLSIALLDLWLRNPLDPFIGAMKREGCLWEPGWQMVVLLHLLAALYLGVLLVAWSGKRGLTWRRSANSDMY